MSKIRFAALAAMMTGLAGCSWMPSLPDLSGLNPWGPSPSNTGAAQPAPVPAAQASAPARPAAPAAGGPAAPEPAHRVMDTTLGKVLATNRGMTLYTYALDTMPGMTMCTDACTSSWPPLIALDDARPTGHWTVVQRPDGIKQWAYGGWPLYGSRDDVQPGDTRGDGRGSGAWKVARP